MSAQDQLLELYNRIPLDAHCESQPNVQQDIMAICWLYNKTTGEQAPCSVCKWKGIKEMIKKYLVGVGKL